MADSVNVSLRLEKEAPIVMNASHSRGHVAVWTTLFVTQALWRPCKVSKPVRKGQDVVVTKPARRTRDCVLTFSDVSLGAPSVNVVHTL